MEQIKNHENGTSSLTLHETNIVQDTLVYIAGELSTLQRKVYVNQHVYADDIAAALSKEIYEHNNKASKAFFKCAIIACELSLATKEESLGNDVSPIASTDCSITEDNPSESQYQVWAVEEPLAGKLQTPNPVRQYSQEEAIDEATPQAPEEAYKAPIPFQNGDSVMEKSKSVGLEQQSALEACPSRASDEQEMNDEIIEDNENQQHLLEVVAPVQGAEDSTESPHHHVIQQSSLTTEPRVVLYACDKTENSLSSND